MIICIFIIDTNSPLIKLFFSGGEMRQCFFFNGFINRSKLNSNEYIIHIYILSFVSNIGQKMIFHSTNHSTNYFQLNTGSALLMLMLLIK